jgi:hypothetical protein
MHEADRPLGPNFGEIGRDLNAIEIAISDLKRWTSLKDNNS